MIRRKQLAHNVSKAVKDCTVGEFLKHGDLSFFMPYQYKHWDKKDSDGIGGKGVSDPLTFYASVDAYGVDDRITFKTTMKELLEDIHGAYESWLDPTDYYLETKDIEMFNQIKGALLNEVARIDKWLQEAKFKENT
jgi:hypothetical protein